jgi:hypothetical protein
MANKNADGRVTVSLANQVRAFNRLTEVMLKDGHGKVSFKEGWSDGRIADESGLSLQLVATIRRKNFGSLGTLPTGARKPTKTQQMLASLTKQVEKLTAEVDEIWETLTEKRNA